MSDIWQEEGAHPPPPVDMTLESVARTILPMIVPLIAKDLAEVIDLRVMQIVEGEREAFNHRMDAQEQFVRSLFDRIGEVTRTLEEMTEMTNTMTRFIERRVMTDTGPMPVADLPPSALEDTVAPPPTPPPPPSKGTL